MKRTRLRFRGALIVALGSMLAACGGEEETADTADASGNHAPIITGSPPADVEEDAAYAFSPSATDADGDPLLFGIDAKPGWATFDTTSGQLSGKPSASNVGTYKGIVVYVSDGKKQTVLPPFDVTVRGRAANNRAPTITGAPATTAIVGTAVHVHSDSNGPGPPDAHLLDPQSAGMGELRHGYGTPAGHSARRQRRHVR